MPNDNPFSELVGIVNKQSQFHAEVSLQGVPPVLGTMTETGVILDDFKHEIQDPLYADWLVKLDMPQISRTAIMAAPVKEDPRGDDMDDGSTKYALTRIDFHGEGDVTEIFKAHIEIKSSLKAGDRVLVIPINRGQDCVIICKVVK